MAIPLYILESDDVAAYYINKALFENAPEEGKKYLREHGGQGETDYLITDGIRIIDHFNIPIPPTRLGRLAKHPP
ncbi:hypothetical protein, partial [Rothia nasimurium]|uniref:hypothetical protein n=1 Tax=Rothia nasimurium TaxID=85336 RepID=UPI001F273C55